MTTSQIAVRLPDGLLEDLDRLIGAGAAPSRAAAVRDALGLWMRLVEERGIDAALEEGYRRNPVDEPDGWGTLSGHGDRSVIETMMRLDAEERDQGLEPW